MSTPFPQGIILEGLVTTTDAQGQVNLAPMGPRVLDQWRRLVLRPFEGSRTLANLRATGRGVFHIIDDVELLARCAIGLREPLPPVRWEPQARGWVLPGACRWYAFEVLHWSGSPPRYEALAQVVAQAQLRPFPGWNRASHAVVEAAILATRVQLLDAQELIQQFRWLAPWVWKTGTQEHHRAFALLVRYVQERIKQPVLEPSAARRIFAGGA